MACLNGPIFGEATKDAYTLESRELTRRHFIQELYADSVLETLNGIWDLDTDTQLSRGRDSGDYGDFLDFDLTSGLSIYRREEAHFSTVEKAFVIEVRDRHGKILFAKRDSVSHKPEALFLSSGRFILSRTNDADTLQLRLELHSVETGALVWSRTPNKTPRWILSHDTTTFTELLTEPQDIFFHTAILFDSHSKEELARIDITNLEIRKDSSYLAHSEFPVHVIRGDSGTLLVNERSKTFSPLTDFRGSFWSSQQSPKSDTHNNYIILMNSDRGFGTFSWAVFDARTGERLATDLELGANSNSFRFHMDPALSANGQLVYHVVGAGEIEAWNPHTKTLVRTINYSNIPFEQLFPSADDRYLLACAFSGINDDFMVLIDTETNLPVYSKFFDDPNPLEPPNSGTYVTGFNRTLYQFQGADHFYLWTLHGLEGFDFATGRQVFDGSKFLGKAIASQYLNTHKSRVTIYETGRVKIENDIDTSTRWIQLPTTLGLNFATIDRNSGSVAIQRDRAFLTIHPFDQREDQWVLNLGLGIYPIRIHRGGKWLAAHYRGIYDLETQQWLLQDDFFDERYAIDETSSRWAHYDSSKDALLLYDHGNNTELKIPLSGRIGYFHALEFSGDGKQLYCLGKPFTGSVYDQSLFVIDLESLSIAQQINLKEMDGTYSFTQIRAHPNAAKVVLGRRNGTLRMVNIDTEEQALPALVEPAFSNKWDSGDFYLSFPTEDNRVSFVDEYGHIYHLSESTARIIPALLSLTTDRIATLDFIKKPESTYWIQSSKNLKDWNNHQNADFLKTWFNSHDDGFFRVYESEENN